MRGLAPVAATISVLGVLGGVGVAVIIIGQGARGPNASTLLITFVVSMLTALVGGVVTLIAALAERSTVAAIIGGLVVAFCLVSVVLLLLGGVSLPLGS
jgi:hypothetical protein